MVQHIQAAMFDHIHSGKLHDLPNLCLIFFMVALGFAFFAHGFRVVGASQSHHKAISQKPCAIRTDKNSLLLNLSDLQMFEGKGCLFSVMMLPTEDSDKSS
jgi:hypothetical protein